MLLLNAAQRAMEDDFVIFVQLGFPAFVIFGFKAVKTSCQFFKLALQAGPVVQGFGIKQAVNGHLFNDFFRRFATERSNQATGPAGFFDQ